MEIKKITKRIHVQKINRKKNPDIGPISKEEGRDIFVCILRNKVSGGKKLVTVWGLIFFNFIFNLYIIGRNENSDKSRKYHNP